jgi:hypothetical protein
MANGTLGRSRQTTEGGERIVGLISLGALELQDEIDIDAARHGGVEAIDDSGHVEDRIAHDEELARAPATTS